MKTVYLAGPVEQVQNNIATYWRKISEEYLQEHGIYALNPLRNKPSLYNTPVLTADGLDSRMIVSRDRYDVANSDVILMNLLNSNSHSIGSYVELGWADILRKPVVIVMAKDDPKRKHPFLNDLSYKICDNLTEALEIVLEILQ